MQAPHKTYSELEFSDRLLLIDRREFLSPAMVHDLFPDRDWSWFTRRWRKACYQTTADGMYSKELVRKIEAAEAKRQDAARNSRAFNRKKSKSKI